MCVCVVIVIIYIIFDKCFWEICILLVVYRQLAVCLALPSTQGQKKRKKVALHVNVNISFFLFLLAKHNFVDLLARVGKYTNGPFCRICLINYGITQEKD